MADKRFHATIDKVLKNHKGRTLSDASREKLERSKANRDLSGLDNEQLAHFAAIRQDYADELARRLGHTER